MKTAKDRVMNFETYHNSYKNLMAMLQAVLDWEVV